LNLVLPPSLIIRGTSRVFGGIGLLTGDGSFDKYGF
jgi:hypothetical protein